MRTSPITLRILVAIGATGFGASVACGGATAPDEGPDAAASSGTDASGDVASIDGSNDAPSPDAATDAAADARPDAPACVRRPFLVSGVTRAGEVARRADWGDDRADTSTALDERTRRALAAAWLEDGLQEHASIAAFARFTLMALSVGARPEHVAGAQRASLDEVAHARACFALARRYGGVDVGPGPVSLADALHTMSLTELAVLTVHEGCVGETLGVQIATEQLAGATDPLVRRALQKIVKDEMRHAALAWSFVKWALDVGEASLRRHVVDAFAEAARASRQVSRTGDPDARMLAEWRAHGRLTGSEIRSIVDAGLRDVIGPCAKALLSPARSRDVELRA